MNSTIPQAVTAYEVFNHAIDTRIALFLTEEAADAYAEGFTQCEVNPVDVPGFLFPGSIAEELDALNKAILRSYAR